MDNEVSPWRAEGEFVLHGEELEGVDFSNLRPRYFSIGVGSRLVRCDFRRLRPTTWPTFGSGMQPTTYVECLFDDMAIKGGGAGRANFMGCSFRDVKIQDYRFMDAQFVDCVFSGHLKSVIFSAAPTSVDDELGRTRNQFAGNDFSKALMEDVSFRGGIDLDVQRFPDNPEYLIIRDAGTVLARAWSDIQQWPQDLNRSRIETKIEVLEDKVRAGQRDIFVTRTSLLRKISPES